MLIGLFVYYSLQQALTLLDQGGCDGWGYLREPVSNPLAHEIGGRGTCATQIFLHLHMIGLMV